MDFDTIESREEMLALVPNYRWAHAIDLGGGIITPGEWGRREFIVRAFDDIDFRGKRVLDIGCWDGLWSFEAEKRGAASVHATDFVSQRHAGGQPTFHLARKLLGSRVRYSPDVSVFDVAGLDDRPFDVVLFLGVYYHLKDPLLALARLRQVMRDGGLIVVEGETIASDQCYANFYYHEHYNNDRSNWWVPTVRCLREWVQCSSFKIKHEHAPESEPRSRHVIVAEAVPGPDPNYAYPDAELPRSADDLGEKTS